MGKDIPIFTEDEADIPPPYEESDPYPQNNLNFFDSFHIFFCFLTNFFD